MSAFDILSRTASEMSDDAVLDTVRSSIAYVLGLDDDEVVPEASLEDDLGCDEIDFKEMMIKIYHDAGYQTPPEEDYKIHTVADLVHMIKRYN